MKRLIDNQLPEALAVFPAAQGMEVRHVRRLGLGSATDAEIWRYASAHGYGIVTMDEDFQHLAARYGTPPQVVWVRLGNVRKTALLAAFTAVLDKLRSALEDRGPVIEVG